MTTSPPPPTNPAASSSTGATIYAIAILRYRRPLDELLAVTDEHRAYLRTLKAAGTIIASGPLDPRTGGALLLRVPEEGALVRLDELRDGDPYVKARLAQYEILPWRPNIGVADLDRL